MNSRGFTLVELAGTLALLGILCAALTGIAGQLHRSSQHASRYAEDLRQCRRACAILAADVRRARRVTETDGVVRIHQPAQTVVYTLADSVLTRAVTGEVAGTHGTESVVAGRIVAGRIVARRIAALQLSQTGTLVDMRVTLQGRVSRSPASIAMRIHLPFGGPE